MSSRVELLKTNEALLSQRVLAIESGAKVTVVTHSTEEDPIRAAQLAAEMEAQTAKLVQARAEANRYSGGLIQAMSLMQAATMANTIAMLEQNHLIAKYGLAAPRKAAEPDSIPNAETPAPGPAAGR
jgi:hypothetical protein